MALTFGDRSVRPLTADEVLRMVDSGILADDEPVELLHGLLTAVSPKSPGHSEVQGRLVDWLAPAVAGGRCRVRVEAPIVVPDRTSLPEPDVAVTEPEGYPDAHPTGALLVIEVAVTSQRVDTRVKPALFAAAGVAEYWVIDVPARAVRTFAEPDGDVYTVLGTVGPNGTLTPRAVDVDPLDVHALLVGL